MPKMRNWRRIALDEHVAKCDVFHGGDDSRQEICKSCKRTYCVPCKEQHPYVMEKQDDLCVDCGRYEYESWLFREAFERGSNAFGYDDAFGEIVD